MRAGLGAVLLIASFLVCSAAQAITVKAVEGEVLLSRGSGYEPIPGTAQAKVGDSVWAGEFGSGQIIYANGCVVTVRPGSVVSVEPQSSCKTPAAWSPHDTSVHGGLSAHHVLLGTAGVAGIGVGIYYLTKSSDDDKPASP